jgi:hypothetical protein
MATQNQALLGIFQGGQMTDLPTYPGGVDLSALFEIVSPGTAAAGINYGINAAALAILINGAYFASPTIITSGASYPSVGTDTRILVDLSVAGNLAITLLSSSSYAQPVLVKDIAGNLAPGAATTVSFSSGQTADGQSSVVLQNAYAGIWFNPLVSGGFYLTAA